MSSVNSSVELDSFLNDLKNFKDEFDILRTSCSSDPVNQKTLSLSETFEEFLVKVAKTGQTVYPWRLVKPIFLVKLDRMMREYNSKEPYDSIDQHTNCAKDTFDKLYSKVMVAADSFPQAPFTMQRLCELLCFSRKHYKRTDKFIRALDKNISVVTTVDEMGNKLSTESTAKESSLPSKVVEVFEWINKPIQSEATEDRTQEHTTPNTDDKVLSPTSSAEAVNVSDVPATGDGPQDRSPADASVKGVKRSLDSDDESPSEKKRRKCDVEEASASTEEESTASDGSDSVAHASELSAPSQSNSCEDVSLTESPAPNPADDGAKEGNSETTETA